MREGKEHDLPSRIAASPDLALTQLLWSGSGITPERNRNGFIFLLARLAPALDESVVIKSLQAEWQKIHLDSTKSSSASS